MFDQFREKAKSLAASGQQAARGVASMGQQAVQSASTSLSKLTEPKSVRELSEEATRILEEFTTLEERQTGFDAYIPASIIKQAKGFAIYRVLKAGVLWSGRAGYGIVVSRLPNGEWSLPSAIGVGGVGFGLQAGGDLTDVVVLLNTEEAVEAFGKPGNVTLGGNLQITMVQLGAGGEASVAASIEKLKLAPMIAYTKSKGAFAGLSVEGTVVMELFNFNEKNYGKDVKAMKILKGEYTNPLLHEEAKSLYDAIERAEAREE